MEATWLWDALGRPRLSEQLPLGKSELRQAARTFLGPAVSLPQNTIRPPTALWQIILGPGGGGGGGAAATLTVRRAVCCAPLASVTTSATRYEPAAA